MLSKQAVELKDDAGCGLTQLDPVFEHSYLVLSQVPLCSHHRLIGTSTRAVYSIESLDGNPTLQVHQRLDGLSGLTR